MHHAVAGGSGCQVIPVARLNDCAARNRFQHPAHGRQVLELTTGIDANLTKCAWVARRRTAVNDHLVRTGGVGFHPNGNRVTVEVGGITDVDAIVDAVQIEGVAAHFTSGIAGRATDERTIVATDSIIEIVLKSPLTGNASGIGVTKSILESLDGIEIVDPPTIAFAVPDFLAIEVSLAGGGMREDRRPNRDDPSSRLGPP